MRAPARSKDRGSATKLVARRAPKRRKRLPYFARLAPHELEILACLAEECGEVCQAIGKVIRHGLASRHPRKANDNRTELGVEVGQVHAISQMAVELGVLRERDVMRGRAGKWLTIAPYLHHIVVDDREQRARRKSKA